MMQYIFTLKEAACPSCVALVVRSNTSVVTFTDLKPNIQVTLPRREVAQSQGALGKRSPRLQPPAQ